MPETTTTTAITMTSSARSLLGRYGAALIFTLAAVGVRILLNPVLEDRAPMAAIYLAAVLATWYGGWGPGVLSLLLGALFADYFFVPPAFTLSMASGHDLATQAFYLSVGGLLVALVAAWRWAQHKADRAAVEATELQQQLQDRLLNLKGAEQRIRAVVDSVVDGIITINERAAIQTFNPAAERIFGYAAEEVIGHNVSLLMPEPEQNQHDQYMENYLRTGVAKIIGIGREVRGRRKDGSVFPLDLAINEFYLDRQRMFVGIMRDVSQRKRSEQLSKFLVDVSAALTSLVDYESTLRRMSRLAIPCFADWCAVYVVDSEVKLRRVAVAHSNPEKTQQVQQLLEHSAVRTEATHGPAQVLRSGRSELVAEVTDAILQEFAPADEDLPVLRSLGIHSLLCVPVSIRGKLFGVLAFATAESPHTYNSSDLALAEDLANRAAVAIENAQLYAEVKDADRRKDEFLAVLAHELRNPLAPIRSGLDLLDMAGVDAETAAWARTMMKQQVQHLVRLVDDLLDVSRIMRGKIQLRKQPVELSDVVRRGIETARPAIENQGHQLLVKLPPQPVWIEADVVRMTQVIANLLNNAAKYNDKPGHIWINGECRDALAILRVRDDGMGIEKSLLPRVFDLFTQADRAAAHAQGGLGIGLTLVRSLLEMHGGSVEARSPGPGKGSEFILRLPAVSPPEAAAAGAEPPKRRGRPRRILIVDDNVAAARLLAEITRRWNHEVVLAHTGAEALAMAARHHPEVVFLDIGLPDMTGYEVAQRLRQQPEFAHTLLVAVTGYGQEEDRRRSRAAGFDQHLVKPVSPDALEALLSQAEMVALAVAKDDLLRKP